ncbi:MAG: (Fe-S)-binding protein [Clostridia bacterium]|nr:(Fe-S)-binding protein [Clostridia bacterium]MBQ3057858.1 (Fe-S)-binding protein [Clostridia bacterium]
MIMSEKCKQHVDSCRFCWMCHHICPIGNATGQERNTARARALGISLVNRDAMELSEIMDNIYECCTCGACVHDCITGWDPVMFTKETRLQAALEGATPDYINVLIDNCLETGNAYGKTATCETLTAAIKAHADKKDTLLLLGVDAKFMACKQALKAIQVLEKAGVDFSVLENEAPTGAQLDFLIGAANETKEQMAACAKVLDDYKTVVVYDPNDAKAIKQLYKEYGIETKANVVTYTSFVASLLRDGKLEAVNSGKAVVFQDPYQLSRDLEETEEAREIIMSYAVLGEMLLNRAETVWAGNILMAQYKPEVIKLVAERRIFNATSIGADTIVTACVGEYVALNNVEQDKVKIISIEDLILG